MKILPQPERALTLEEMDQAVGEHVAEKHLTFDRRLLKTPGCEAP